MTSAIAGRRPAARTLGGRSLAWAGLAGIACYALIDVVLKFLRPEYSLLYNAESDYGRGPWFWVMDGNFLLRCALSLAVIAAIARTSRLGGWLRAGLTLLSVWAICSGLLAFFADDIEGTPQRGSGVVHLILAFIAFTCVTIGAIATSTALRASADWRSVTPVLAAVSVLGAVAFLLLGHAAGHQHEPGGLYERIFLGVELIWFALAAVHVITTGSVSPAS
jgi:hypothetical membrane protein